MNLFNKITSNRVAGVFAGLVFCAAVCIIVSNPPVLQISRAQAVGISNLAAVFQVNASDACLNPTIAKVSAPVSISTATTTTLTPAVSSRAQYLCGLRVSAAAAQTVTLVTGSGTNCAHPPPRPAARSLSVALLMVPSISFQME